MKEIVHHCTLWYKLLAMPQPGCVTGCTLHSTVRSPPSIARTHRLPPTTCSSSSLFPLPEIILPQFLPSLHIVHMVPPQGDLLTPYVKRPPTRYPLSQHLFILLKALITICFLCVGWLTYCPSAHLNIRLMRTGNGCFLCCYSSSAKHS